MSNVTKLKINDIVYDLGKFSDEYKQYLDNIEQHIIDITDNEIDEDFPYYSELMSSSNLISAKHAQVFIFTAYNSLNSNTNINNNEVNNNEENESYLTGVCVSTYTYSSDTSYWIQYLDLGGNKMFRQLSMPVSNGYYSSTNWTHLANFTTDLLIKLSQLPTNAVLNNSLNQKQNKLVSGTSIKTIDGNNLLSAGNIKTYIYYDLTNFNDAPLDTQREILRTLYEYSTYHNHSVNNIVFTYNSKPYHVICNYVKSHYDNMLPNVAVDNGVTMSFIGFSNIDYNAFSPKKYYNFSSSDDLDYADVSYDNVSVVNTGGSGTNTNNNVIPVNTGGNLLNTNTNINNGEYYDDACGSITYSQFIFTSYTSGGSIHYLLYALIDEPIVRIIHTLDATDIINKTYIQSYVPTVNAVKDLMYYNTQINRYVGQYIASHESRIYHIEQSLLYQTNVNNFVNEDIQSIKEELQDMRTMLEYLHDAITS